MLTKKSQACSAHREVFFGSAEQSDSRDDDKPQVWHCLVSQLANGAAPSTPLQEELQGFPGGAVVENLPANAGDTGSSPGLGRSHMPRSN